MGLRAAEDAKSRFAAFVFGPLPTRGVRRQAAREVDLGRCRSGEWRRFVSWEKAETIRRW